VESKEIASGHWQTDRETDQEVIGREVDTVDVRMNETTHEFLYVRCQQLDILSDAAIQFWDKRHHVRPQFQFLLQHTTSVQWQHLTTDNSHYQLPCFMIVTLSVIGVNIRVLGNTRGPLVSDAQIIFTISAQMSSPEGAKCGQIWYYLWDLELFAASPNIQISVFTSSNPICLKSVTQCL